MPGSLTLLLAILAVGFLIVVHEGGHYFAARWCGMRVERFSIGFGPGLLKHEAKSGTVFQLAPIPFGGFVEIRGMNIAEDIDPDDVHAYPNRPAWQRFVTIFAGPATNYLSAIVLAFGLYTCHGVDDTRRLVVAEVKPEYDARGKLASGDRIVEVNRRPYVIAEGQPTLPELINEAKGAPVTLTVERDGARLDVMVRPKLDNEATAQALAAVAELQKVAPDAAAALGAVVKRLPEQKWRIGVVQQAPVVSVGVVDATKLALKYPVAQTKAIGAMLYGIVFGSEKADPGGPIRMVEEFQNQFSQGLSYGVKLLMALSVYLGLFNLLPIPALDGGRLVFLAYELVTRRRPNPKIEAMVHMAGIMALAVVMILVLIVDVRRLF